MKHNDIARYAVEFIEAVKAEDEEAVRRVLSSPLAARVAVEVAAMCGQARRDAAESDAAHKRLRSCESQLALASATNRRLVQERDELRERLTAYRSGRKRHEP